MKRAASEAWLFVRISLRLVAIGVLCWVMARAVSHGGVWYLLLIPLAPLVLFQLLLSSAILWSWGKELRGVRAHS